MVRHIWFMHLKDNRACNPDKSSDVKFQVCKQHNIVAIGWYGVCTEKDQAFKRAYQALASMQRGDLVWVQNPKCKEHYLCEILNDRIIEFPEKLALLDMAQGRICEYHAVKATEPICQILPVCRHTIQAITDSDICEKTCQLFAQLTKN